MPYTAECRQNLMLRVWHWLDSAVDKLTVNQTAAIGGSGSIASAGGVIIGVDQVVSILQLLTVVMGLMGALLSVGLMSLKLWQQHREMSHWHKTKDED